MKVSFARVGIEADFGKDKNKVMPFVKSAFDFAITPKREKEAAKV